MRYRSIAASLVIAGLGISSAEAMPLLSAPKLSSNIISVDYTCGDGMHFTNAAGCVADSKPTPAKPQARKQQVRKHKVVRTKKHRPVRRAR